MRKPMLVIAGLAAACAGFVVAWRRNPRIGTRFTNDVLNPFLVERGLSGAGRSEIGTLEHIGRVTGTRHLTPVHPVPTADGFRIAVPLGPKSQWAANVLAAGHCRIQLHDTVHDLDEPVLLAAGEMPDIGGVWLLDRLGVQYLLVRRFAQEQGSLEKQADVADVAPAELEEPVGAATS